MLGVKGNTLADLEKEINQARDDMERLAELSGYRFTDSSVIQASQYLDGLLNTYGEILNREDELHHGKRSVG